MKSKEKEYNDKETLFGKVPYDWNVSNIGEIADLRQGLQISKKLRVDSNTLGAIPLLKITDMPQKCFSEYVKDVPEQYIADENDIIYTRTGQVGLVYTNLNGCVHNNCFKVIVDYNYFDKQYIYYYLSSKNVEKYSNNVAGGSVQKDLTHGAFKTCKIAYPSLKEQKVIAKILSDLDEKIEVNNKINKNLEEMAQAIFKQWFVDFEFPNEEGKPYKSSGGEMVESELGMIPKGWKICELNELSTLTMGLSPKSSSYNTEGTGTPLLNGAADFNNGLIKANKYTTQETRVCEKGDLVFCIRATIGNLTFSDNKYCLGRGVAALRAKREIFICLIYMNLLNSIEKLKSQATGSVILGLSKPDINNMKVLYPNLETLTKYSNAFFSLFNKKEEIIRENERIEKLRDTLLPKLMSGEIRVPLENNEN